MKLYILDHRPLKYWKILKISKKRGRTKGDHFFEEGNLARLLATIYLSPYSGELEEEGKRRCCWIGLEIVDYDRVTPARIWNAKTETGKWRCERGISRGPRNDIGPTRGRPPLLSVDDRRIFFKPAALGDRSPASATLTNGPRSDLPSGRGSVSTDLFLSPTPSFQSFILSVVEFSSQRNESSIQKFAIHTLCYSFIAWSAFQTFFLSLRWDKEGGKRNWLFFPFEEIFEKEGENFWIDDESLRGGGGEGGL